MAVYTVALAGNPNTGKSTLFNLLTGLRQHTGNWAGKTVDLAQGDFTHNGHEFRMIDLPGTYSLFSNSKDEEVTRDFIVFEEPDVTIVVLDATSLERNMNLALQVLEMTSRVVVCINLIDEAKRLGIHVDTELLSRKLGVPVAAISARNKIGISGLLSMVASVATGEIVPEPVRVRYQEELERKLALLEPVVRETLGLRFSSRWLALRLLDEDTGLLETLRQKMKGGEFVPRKGDVNHGRSACHNLA
jgi:small GTP-binding protein